MMLLVSYDVHDDGRRERIARILEAWGERVQLSVFLLDEPGLRPAAVLDALEPLLTRRRDRLGVYPLCSACLRRSRHLRGQRRSGFGNRSRSPKPFRAS